MDLMAVPTGVNKHVAAYGYRGGSFFDKRDFNIGAVLIKHQRFLTPHQRAVASAGRPQVPVGIA